MAPTLPFSLHGQRILVAGHRGMVGSAVLRRLAALPATRLTIGREDADLRRQSEVERAITALHPDVVIIAAATVGGIYDNQNRQAEFLYDNLMIAANLIEAARQCNVRKLLFLGSTCIFPAAAAQPIREDSLLTGPLEPTNEGYAVAKIAGIKLCDMYRRQYGCDYITAQPTNLYGPNDNYHPTKSHVLAALMRKIYEAKRDGRAEITLWGSGQPTREFLHADDLADAIIFLLENYSQEGIINVGSGEEVSILRLAQIIANIVGWSGRFDFDRTKPDGMMRKLSDSGRLRALGWKPSHDLERGIAAAYEWFLSHAVDARGEVIDRPRVDDY